MFGAGALEQPVIGVPRVITMSHFHAQFGIRRWLLVAAAMVVCTRAGATLYYIEFRDSNDANPNHQLPDSEFANQGGPYWTAEVDTVANTLKILSWRDLPGTQEFWWVPDLAQSPIIWHAVQPNPNDPNDADGIGFEIPEDNPLPDSTWAFISSVPASQMNWKGRTTAGVESSRTYNAGQNNFGDFYPGWGGYRAPGALPDLTFGYKVTLEEMVLGALVHYDYRYMPLLPMESLPNSDPNQISSSAIVDLAGVTMSIIASSDPGGPAAVPEVPASLFGMAAVAVSAVIGCVARRRRG